MPPNSPSYTIEQIAEAASVAPRTIRQWIAEGLVPAPKFRAARTRYSEAQKERVLAVKRLREAGVPIDRVGKRLAEEEALAAARAEEVRRAASMDVVRLPPRPSYPAVAWEHVALGPGLVLLVNPAGGPIVRRTAQAIYEWFGPGGEAQLPPGTPIPEGLRSSDPGPQPSAPDAAIPAPGPLAAGKPLG